MKKAVEKLSLDELQKKQNYLEMQRTIKGTTNQYSLSPDRYSELKLIHHDQERECVLPSRWNVASICLIIQLEIKLVAQK
jgi:hypothetical protein